METKTQQGPQNVPAKKETSQSERFTQMVVKEFTSGTGDVALTNFQKRLCQNYFMTIDYVLKTSEEKRLKKSEQYRDPLAITWQNVNMELLARNVVSYARIGMDPALKNHIHLIPFKNNTTNKYDITFMEGYRGLEIKAKKYGLEVPDDVIVEVVYKNDEFIPFKKDKDNKIESYVFKITKSFDRGEVVGGFYYHSFFDHPEKNKLMFYSVDEIIKRKPTYASPEFWGGEKDKYEKKDGKSVKVGTEKVEGWYPEMVYKTLCRAAYGSITIDSQKIDDDYLRLQINEKEAEKNPIKEEITTNSNKQFMDFDDAQIVDEPKPSTSSHVNQQPAQTQAAPKQQNQPQQQTLKPDFE